jgi:hypothetical protein
LCHLLLLFAMLYFAFCYYSLWQHSLFRFSPNSALDIKVYHSRSLRFNIKVKITIFALPYIHFDIKEMNRFKNVTLYLTLTQILLVIWNERPSESIDLSVVPLREGRNEIWRRESVLLSNPRGMCGAPERHCTAVVSAFRLFLE